MKGLSGSLFPIHTTCSQIGRRAPDFAIPSSSAGQSASWHDKKQGSPAPRADSFVGAIEAANVPSEHSQPRFQRSGTWASYFLLDREQRFLNLARRTPPVSPASMDTRRTIDLLSEFTISWEIITNGLHRVFSAVLFRCAAANYHRLGVPPTMSLPAAGGPLSIAKVREG